MVNQFGMIRGRRYRIVYQRFGGRVLDVCVAQYLWDDEVKREVTLNLRPKAGTSSLLYGQIRAVEETTDDIMLPKRNPDQTVGQ